MFPLNAASELPDGAVLTVKVKEGPISGKSSRSGLSYVRWESTVESSVHLPEWVLRTLQEAGQNYVRNLWTAIQHESKQTVKNYVTETRARHGLATADQSEDEAYGTSLNKAEVTLHARLLEAHNSEPNALERAVRAALTASGLSWDDWKRRGASIVMDPHLQASGSQLGVTPSADYYALPTIRFTDSPPSGV